MDPNLIIAIISVSAIFSPTIVAIIDNVDTINLIVKELAQQISK